MLARYDVDGTVDKLEWPDHTNIRLVRLASHAPRAPKEKPKGKPRGKGRGVGGGAGEGGGGRMERGGVGEGMPSSSSSSSSFLAAAVTEGMDDLHYREGRDGREGAKEGLEDVEGAGRAGEGGRGAKFNRFGGEPLASNGGASSDVRFDLSFFGDHGGEGKGGEEGEERTEGEETDRGEEGGEMEGGEDTWAAVRTSTGGCSLSGEVDVLIPSERRLLALTTAASEACEAEGEVRK